MVTRVVGFLYFKVSEQKNFYFYIYRGVVFVELGITLDKKEGKYVIN
jgi:hypothetical protein